MNVTGDGLYQLNHSVTFSNFKEKKPGTEKLIF